MPDLYIIVCPKGVRSDPLTLVEVAKMLALLAEKCGETHKIVPAEELTTTHNPDRLGP